MDYGGAETLKVLSDLPGFTAQLEWTVSGILLWVRCGVFPLIPESRVGAQRVYRSDEDQSAGLCFGILVENIRHLSLKSCSFVSFCYIWVHMWYMHQSDYMILFPSTSPRLIS